VRCKAEEEGGKKGADAFQAEAGAKTHLKKGRVLLAAREKEKGKRRAAGWGSVTRQQAVTGGGGEGEEGGGNSTASKLVLLHRDHKKEGNPGAFRYVGALGQRKGKGRGGGRRVVHTFSTSLASAKRKERGEGTVSNWSVPTVRPNHKGRGKTVVEVSLGGPVSGGGRVTSAMTLSLP